jgi:hypothetical protein
MLCDKQVAGRADREIFGDPFDHAEDECLPRFHVEISKKVGKLIAGGKAFAVDSAGLPEKGGQVVHQS